MKLYLYTKNNNLFAQTTTGFKEKTTSRSNTQIDLQKNRNIIIKLELKRGTLRSKINSTAT